jgi:hypothetical protein
MMHCPRCGSGRIATRRRLFHAGMEACPEPPGFHWYDRNARGALPPRSVFLQLFLLMLATLGVLSLATLAGLASTGVLAAGSLSAAILVSAGLVMDVGYTLRRYRAWAREALCADCRTSFVAGATQAP